MPDDAKNELASKLNSIRHLREALDHLEIVMGFLAAGGEENGNMLIAKYAELLNIKSFNTTVSEFIILIYCKTCLYFKDWRPLFGTDSIFVESGLTQSSN